MPRFFFLVLLLSVCSFTSIQAQVQNPPKQNIKLNNKKITTVKPNVKLADLLAQKITLEDIDEWLCPKTLLRGDREFDGHGPRMKSEVKLRIGRDSTTLLADIYLWAQETQYNYSTTEGRWTRKVYDAPYGQKILRIKSDAASRTQFISPPAGFQFLFPGADVKTAMEKFFDGASIANAVLAAHGIVDPAQATQQQIGRLISTYMRGNTVVSVPPTEGTLVKFFHIVGDTGGEDISTDDDCNDDTRIVKIEFFPVTVDMIKIKK